MKPGRFWLMSVLLLLATAVSYLLGNGSAPLLDRDEPRYALTSRNMLASGDFIVPRQYDRPRTAKPPLIYWAQAAAMHLTGEGSAWAARLPSAMAMWLVVLGVLLVVRKETDDLTALLAATMFAFSGLTVVLAKVCITDAVLLLSVVAASYCLYRLWRGDRGWWVFVLLGLSIGLAGLTKGPVVLGLLGTTLLALLGLSLLDRKFPANAPWRTFPYAGTSERRAGWPGWVLAALVVAVIVLPWIVLVERQSPGFLTTALSHDVVKRSTQGVDGQARPPGFYLLTLFGTYFPWSLLLPATVVIAFRNRHRPLTRFCLAACIGPWLMFEAVTSKMVHWFLPVFVPLAVLSAEAVVRCCRGKYVYLNDRPFVIAAGVWAVVVTLAGLAPLAAAVWMPPTPWWALAPVSVLMAGLGCGAFACLRRGKLPAAVAVMGAGMAILGPLLFTLVLPNLWFVRLAKDTGLELARLGATTPGRVVMIEFKEPSIAFYQGGTIREADADALSRPGVEWVVIPRHIFDAQPESRRTGWSVVWSRRGIAYADSPGVIEAMILHRPGISYTPPP
jgi:4-amino-4-deoxy-L-arabinose transferase-like glycosyltransferase